MKNRLPKYYIVKNDGSQLFKYTVLKHLDLIDKDNKYKWIDHATYDYYGFDGDIDNSGTKGSNYIDTFINNPTLLTLEEFIELSKSISIEDWIPEVGDKVKIIQKSLLSVNKVGDVGVITEVTDNSSRVWVDGKDNSQN